MKSLYEYIIEKCIVEAHHLLNGDNSLGELAADLVEFLQFQFSHSINKNKEYDNKKFIYYYIWDYNEIVKWFADNKKAFHYPAFLIENNSTICLKISVGRMVKGRKKQHNDIELISLYGNERGSHSTKSIDGNSKNHTIYLNAYLLAKENGMGVREFIMSDKFEKELTGTVRHEFMHAFDSYMIVGQRRAKIDKMKAIYKNYRKNNNIKKNWMKFENCGVWNGSAFAVDEDFMNEGNNLRTFYYILLYYLTDTEMNAYLQTFYNQLVSENSSNPYDSDIYRRYKIIKSILECSFSKDAIQRNFDDMTKNEIGVSFGIKSNDLFVFYEKLRLHLLEIVDRFFVKLHKILFDIAQAL